MGKPVKSLYFVHQKIWNTLVNITLFSEV